MLLLLLVRSDPEKIRDLEDEQEELNGSLLALTSHFAQVHGCIFYYYYPLTSFFGEGCVMYLNGVCKLGASKIYKNNVWAKTLGERLI